ncbi:hypothetical protein glysoja_030591 [Glycine soja]|uniref:Uncharacterized protein n=1 Tax=Glycine soja TaxID=3848 RepID=A0A0B2SQA2_GLYSO|nr:hypothetical protein glysoja_030591 [Glycine soja]
MGEQQHRGANESLLKLVSIPDGLGLEDDSNNMSKLDLCIGWALNFGAKFGIFALVYNLPKLIDDGIIDSDGGNNIILIIYYISELV